MTIDERKKRGGKRGGKGGKHTLFSFWSLWGLGKQAKLWEPPRTRRKIYHPWPLARVDEFYGAPSAPVWPVYSDPTPPSKPIIVLISPYSTSTRAEPTVRSALAPAPLKRAPMPSSLATLAKQSSVPLYSH